MYPPPYEPRRPLIRRPDCLSVIVTLVVLAAGVWLAIRSAVHWLIGHAWYILGMMGITAVTAGIVIGLSIANYLGRTPRARPPDPPD